MQKVGLLTFQKISNYGAVLQGYALQQAIKAAGYDCEVIDLLFPVHQEYREVPRARSPLPAQPESLSAVIRLRIFLRKMLCSYLFRRQQERFAQFCDRHMVFSARRYYSFDELYQAPPQYDGYVTGSDQVWNPTFKHNPEPYFLTFAESGRPRIAYAPSFGISEIPREIWPLYREWLQGMTHLSVREHQGAQIVEEISAQAAQVVLDPTLLLDAEQWQQVAGSAPQFPYIFCYALGDPPQMMELCYHLAALSGLPILKIGDLRDVFNRRITTIRDAGPAEFLGLVRNATVVVTNSFHGTCFSINFRRPFYAVPTVSSTHLSKNSRLTSLLERLGLEQRLFGSGSAMPELDQVEIDYREVEHRLAQERERSLLFLTEALGSLRGRR